MNHSTGTPYIEMESLTLDTLAWQKDEDGSGEIDVIELQHAMTDMGVGQDSEGNGGLSKTAAKELMKHIDTDGGGLIAYEQFKTALNTIAEIAV